MKVDGPGRHAVGRAMQPVSYARHQFPAEIIRHAVWLYLRFTLSYRGPTRAGHLRAP
jgi:hypothetical protein